MLVSQLCLASAHTPSAVTLHCEQILCDVSRFDPPSFIQTLLPYTTTSGNEGTFVRAQVILACASTLPLVLGHVFDRLCLCALSMSFNDPNQQG